MRGDVAQAFGLAGFASDGGDYEPTVTERAEEAPSWFDFAACHPRHKPDTMTRSETNGANDARSAAGGPDSRPNVTDTARQDATQWTAVLEALDEAEARIPEASPHAFLTQGRIDDVRDAARDALRDLQEAP